MSDVKRAKELAAQAAGEVYCQRLAEALAGPRLGEAIASLGGTRHVHTALIIDQSTGAAALIRAEWTFTTDPAAITAAVAQTRAEGRG